MKPDTEFHISCHSIYMIVLAKLKLYWHKQQKQQKKTIEDRQEICHTSSSAIWHLLSRAERLIQMNTCIYESLRCIKMVEGYRVGNWKEFSNSKYIILMRDTARLYISCYIFSLNFVKLTLEEKYKALRKDWKNL